MFVVECTEMMRDGRESFSKIVGSIEEAQSLIEKYANGFAGDNCEFRVFELGQELKINIQTKRKKKPIEYEQRRVVKVGK